MHAADADHRRISGIHPARNDRLERTDERSGADDRVGGLVRPGGVRTAAQERDLEAVGRGRERPLLGHDFAYGEAPVDVGAKDGRHAVELSRLEHGLRPAAGLLGRLQHDQHVARGGTRREEMGGAHRPGRVHVVPAGVHHAGVLGGEREARLLGDRQRVDVAAHRDRGAARVAAADPRHDARAGDALEPNRPGLDPRERG